MAKHMVKCFYCEHMFDANKEPYVKVKTNRYAHECCHNQSLGLSEKELKDKQDLEDYIKNLFNYEVLPESVNRQIKKYYTENKYTYSGMLKSLIYYYEIKHGDKEKAFGRVGIIPYVYEEAYRYYYAIWEAQQRSTEIVKKVLDIEAPTVEIRIPPPQRKPMITKRKLFTFLEEEDE